MSKPVSSTIRQHSSYETDSESDSIVSTASSSEQDSASENDSGKSPKAPAMKVRQAPDTVPIMPAMAKANMAPSSPTLTNRQVVEQKRAQYGQGRHLPSYQRDTNINKIKTIKQDAIADILENFDNQIANKKVKIESLLKLKKSLMQNLLTGKVRVDLSKIDNFLNEQS